MSAETGSGDRLGSKSAVRVQASPPQPNWVSTGQACPWLRLDPRYRHNSSQWCREALSICLRADTPTQQPVMISVLLSKPQAGSGNWISQMNVGHLFVFLSFTNCDLVAEVVISDGENWGEDRFCGGRRYGTGRNSYQVLWPRSVPVLNLKYAAVEHFEVLMFQAIAEGLLASGTVLPAGLMASAATGRTRNW